MKKMLVIILVITIVIVGAFFIINSLNKQNSDWVCISGKKAGPITALTSVKELKKIFGEKNVTSSKELVAEGTEEITATYIYKGTKNELEIRWKENKTFQKIAGVVINNQGANWKTIEGITTGTTLEELNKINQKPFKFWGFGWDYGGYVFNWGNGKLMNKRISVELERTAHVGDSEFLGEREVSSDDIGLQILKVIVTKVYITL